MSDINFCNTKEQLNHLGEVVTGKVDGSPTGADIDTSTLPYTGQVRKTLPALENEYEQSIADKETEADAAIDAYRLLSKGPYTAGIELEDKFQYITYNGEPYFAANPPYTTTVTTPDADVNLFVGGYISQASISTYTNLVFPEVSVMVSSSVLKEGDSVKTLKYNHEVVSDWKIVASGAGDMSDGTLLLSSGLYAQLVTRFHGNVLEFGAFGDGVTDDRQYFELARDATKTAVMLTGKIYTPATINGYKLSPGLDLTLVDFFGDGVERTKLLFDNEATDCITSGGNTSISNVSIDGGWDGVSSGLSGDILSAFNTGGAGGFTGRFNLTNVRLKNARRDSVALSNVGYSQLYNVRSNASGRHGLHLDGQTFGNCTTISTYGCVFSDCPNGYGVRQYDGHNITHIGLISEFTLGYELAGSQMRATSLQGYYNEFGTGTDYVTLSGSGIGLSVIGGFGGGKMLGSSSNYLFLKIGANSNVTHGTLAGNDYINATGVETIISTTGVTESTLAQVTLQPGVYMLSFTVQSKDQGAASLNSIWAQVTTNVADSGKNVATSTDFNQLSDGRVCQSGEIFVRLGSGQFKIVVASASTYYLRCQVDVAATNILLRGTIQVEPLQ